MDKARLNIPFPRRRIRRIWRGTVVGVLIGVVSGLGAIVFNFLLQAGTRFFTVDLISWITGSASVREFMGIPLGRWMMVWIPGLGGLISGLLVFTFAPEAEGHGTDAMIDSFHRKKGVIRRRVPLIKTIASAITIGSGGSAGKEGPIAQIGAGFGSFLASILKVSDRERRIMVLAGAAGGIGAIFKAPLGAALFATEVLYGREDFEFEAIIPCILSSIVAFMVFTFYNGNDAIFHIPNYSPATAAQLPFYAVLGLLCALIGFPYIRFFYGIRDRFFRRLNLPKAFKPALGGLMVGAVALFLPEILSGGYPWMQAAIDGRLAIQLMAVLVFAKIVVTSFTISSGGSGGVFAPSLFIGSMLGGAFGNACQGLFPHIVTEPSAFVLVGMGGFFAGVAKVPIAALIMVMEMTGGYNLIVPMMIVTSLSYLLLGRNTLYEKQVATRIDSPAHLGDFAVDVMDHLKVKDAMTADRVAETIPENMGFDEILQLMKASSQQDFPVVDTTGRLTGIVSMTDLRSAMAESTVHGLLVAKDISIGRVATVTMDDSLNTALQLMASLDVRELPVVTSEHPDRITGLVSRKDAIIAYHSEMERLKKKAAPKG
jgi:CIC family chloride channel protein